MTTRTEIVSDVWKRRKAWSSAADRFQSRTRTWRRLQLFFIVAGSALATAAATDLFGLNAQPVGEMALGNKIISACAAASLGLVGFIQHHFLSFTQAESWPRARSVSEALKSQVFRLQAGAYPYELSQELDEAAALRRFSDIVAAEEDKAADLLPEVQFGAAMSDGAPGQLDPSGYIKARLDDQIESFYLPSAQKNLRRAKTARGATILLAGLGLLISVFMSAGILAAFGAWVSVLTTVSAAIATFAALNRYEALAALYAKQAVQLDRLKRGWQAQAFSKWSDYVNACEETISAEHRSWMAEMVKQADTLAGVLPKTAAETAPP